MCHRFSFLVLFINIFLIHFQYIIMFQEVEEKGERNRRETVRRFSEISQDWMKEILNVNKELLDVQAIIAKDEESTTNCMTGAIKTNKRHLMCVGSIVNVQHVLTSATCIQEATYIRHNLKAPLVVVVGILKSKPQVIRVNNYNVHPKHVALPYDSQHSKHNIAVIKLSCRIATEHFTPIELPKAPFTELCPNDNCMVAIIRKVGKTSHVIYDTWAKHIPVLRRKRRLTETTLELQNNNTFKTPPANIEEKLRKTLLTPRSLELKEEQDVLLNNITQTVPELFKMGKSMATKDVEERSHFGYRQQISVTPTTSNIIDEYTFQGDSNGNNKARLFSIRASDGFQGCPQSGSPVMFGNIQAALVSVSCDDRQPETPWKYTDIFSNLDWIEKETETWMKDPNNRSSLTPGCSTCIYNFFIDLTGPNDTVNCTNLDDYNEKSSNYKFCASNYEKEVKNHLRSILPIKSNPSLKEKLNENNQQFFKLNFPVNFERSVILQNQSNKKRDNGETALFNKQNNELKKNVKKYIQNFQEPRKNVKKVHGKNFKDSKQGQNDFQKGKSGNFQKTKMDKKGDILKNDKGSNFRTMQIVPQKVYLGNKNLYRNNNEGLGKQFQNDGLKNMKMNNEIRLKKQIDKSSMNDYPRVKTINSQQSIDYNLLANKFHNLRLLLARLQNSTPGKERPLIGKPIQILSHDRPFNSLKFAKNVNTSPGVEKQFTINNVKS